MDIILTHLTDGTPTDDPDAANQLTVSVGGRRAMTLVRATHPRYRVQGYSLNPHPQDPNARLSRGYNPDAFAGGYLDPRFQNRMWVDPDMTQPDDLTRDPAAWDTLGDLVAALRPRLKS